MANKEKNTDSNQTFASREEIAALLTSIGKNVVESNTNYVHSMIALNQILRHPQARELFDNDLKAQARDLWVKVKSAGLQLIDPPLLFNWPEITQEDSSDSEDDELDSDSSSKITDGTQRAIQTTKQHQPRI